MAVSYIQQSFSGGEFDPQGWSRTDQEKYATGMRQAENFLVNKFGTINNRPGFSYLGATKVTSTRSRLIPFIYSDDQAYILEFGVGYIRFWNADGTAVKSSDSPVEVITAYTEAQLRLLRFTQSADTVFISCYGVKPRVLVRNSSTSWSISDYAYKWGPFLTENVDDDIKITPSGTSGSITLVANNSIFQSGHVGSIWRLDQNVSGATAKVEFTTIGQTASLGCGYSCTWRFVTHGSDWKARVIVERSYDNGVTWLQLRSYTGNADGNYNVYAEETEQCLIRARVVEYTSGTLTVDLSIDPYVNQGIIKITGYTSATQVTATVDSTYTLGGTGATNMWYEAAWSDVQGWPAAICFWQDRLMFGGTSGSPHGVWLSKTADYYNFITSSPDSEDSDSINVTFTSRKQANIHTLIPLRESVIAMSEDGVNTVSYSGSSLTPSTITQRSETYQGAKAVDPAVVGTRLIYVQETGGVIHDLAYDYMSDSYQGNEVSIYASHLISDGEVVEMAYQQEPDSTVFMVRDDGVALAMMYQIDQKMCAWTHLVTDGAIESLCVVPYDNRTRLWAVVKRTVNGSTVRFIERLSKRLPTTDPADQLYLDAAYTYSSASAQISSISIPWLAGRTVKVVLDGSTCPDQVVDSDGALTLPKAAYKVAVGLGYTATLQTLNLEVQGVVKGTMQGRLVRIGKVIVRFLYSRGGKIGQSLDYLEEWQRRNATDYLGKSMALYTGDAEFSAGFEPEEGGRIFIVQDEPMPMTILGIITSMEVSND